MNPEIPFEVWEQVSLDTRADWDRISLFARASVLHVAAGRAACQLEGRCAEDHRVSGRCPRCWKVR